MRVSKPAETFVTSLNDMLADGQLGVLEDAQALKSLNRLLGAIAPGHTVLTMRDVEGQLVGFSPFRVSEITHAPHTPAPPAFDAGALE